MTPVCLDTNRILLAVRVAEPTRVHTIIRRIQTATKTLCSGHKKDCKVESGMGIGRMSLIRRERYSFLDARNTTRFSGRAWGVPESAHSGSCFSTNLVKLKDYF